MNNIGVLITDGQQIAQDTYGYVVWLHITDTDLCTIYQVQASANFGSIALSSPVLTPSDEGSLYAFCSTSDCPDVAFYQRDQELYVFLKGSNYPFDDTVGLAFWYYRNTVETTLSSSLIDIPEEARLLLALLVVKKIHELKGVNTPYQLENRINTEKRRLGLSPIINHIQYPVLIST